jgi:hypothetical protein
VKKAIDLLQGVAGPSSPVLFLKMDTKDWTPVGEENFFSIVPGKNSKAAVVLCDVDGNSKAITEFVPADQARASSDKLKARGVEKFDGEVRLPI